MLTKVMKLLEESDHKRENRKTEKNRLNRILNHTLDVIQPDKTHRLTGLSCGAIQLFSLFLSHICKTYETCIKYQMIYILC